MRLITPNDQSPTLSKPIPIHPNRSKPLVRLHPSVNVKFGNNGLVPNNIISSSPGTAERTKNAVTVFSICQKHVRKFEMGVPGICQSYCYKKLDNHSKALLIPSSSQRVQHNTNKSIHTIRQEAFRIQHGTCQTRHCSSQEYSSTGMNFMAEENYCACMSYPASQLDLIQVKYFVLASMQTNEK